MENGMRRNFIKKIILTENLLLMLFVLVNPIAFLFSMKALFAIATYSCFVLYPLILISYIIGFALKAIKLSEHKLNLILFSTNIVLSLSGFLLMLYELGRALVGF